LIQQLNKWNNARKYYILFEIDHIILFPLVLLFQEDYGPVRQYCNVWRNFWDVTDTFDSVKGIVNYYGKNNALFQKYSGPGGYFDPDMVGIVYILQIT